MISNSGVPLKSITKMKSPKSIIDSVRTSLKIGPKKVNSKNISKSMPNCPGTSLVLVTKMTLVTDRIDLKSARSIFNSLRTSLKIKLPVDLVNSIDGIIMNNMTAFLDNYAYDLSDIR